MDGFQWYYRNIIIKESPEQQKKYERDHIEPDKADTNNKDRLFKKIYRRRIIEHFNKEHEAPYKKKQRFYIKKITRESF